MNVWMSAIPREIGERQVMSMMASVQWIRRSFCRIAEADLRASYTIERSRSAIPIVTIAVTMSQCRSARSETSPISGTSSSARR